MSYRSFISLFSICFHFGFFKLRVFRSNKIKIKFGVLLWKCKIVTKGKNNSISVGKNVNLTEVNISIRRNNNRVIICDNVKVFDYAKILIEGNNCKIYIGTKSTLGSGHIFCGESNTSIEIGENSMLSREIFMNTSDFHSIMDADSSKRINPPKDIKIGNQVWLGYNSRLNKGAVIGDHSVVATGSIVSGKTYPSNVILAGIPAKII